MRGADGWFCVLCGRGGGPIVIGVVIPGPMKSGRGREWRLLWPSAVKGKGVAGPVAIRTGA